MHAFVNFNYYIFNLFATSYFITKVIKFYSTVFKHSRIKKRKKILPYKNTEVISLFLIRTIKLGFSTALHFFFQV